MSDKPRVVLYGGHVIDPANAIDDTLNVVLEDGVLTALTKEQPARTEFENAVDVSGCIVVPGLIDHHCHMYPLNEQIGLPTESVMFSNGVTTVADAGSCGAANYGKHRSFRAQTRMSYKAYINVSPLGLNAPEDLDPARLDEGALRELFAECGDELLGLKIRTSRAIVGEFGYAPLRRTVAIAERLGVPVMVHPTDPPGEMEELLGCLRAGDVCTHMYMNIGSAITDENGRVKQCALDARRRGVLFEAADARAHFGFSTAVPAIREGFLPDFIATDGTVKSMLMRPTTFSLAMQLARYEALGMDFKSVLRCCTVNPARDMRLTHGEGSLTVGLSSDVAVFRKHEREVVFGDRTDLAPNQHTLVGHVLYEPIVTVKSGMVVYRSIMI